MLVDIIVVVLKKTLEAGILISVILSIGGYYKFGVSWVFKALMAGLAGGILWALNLDYLSGMFEEVGQEVIGASMQIVIYFLLVMICVARCNESAKRLRYLPWILGAAIAVVFVLKGGELAVFYFGFLNNEAGILNAVIYGFIGLSVGISASAVCFYALAEFSSVHIRKAHIIVLCFIAGGMALQATQLLVQADWLPTYEPIWDSNWLLSESSVAGQITHAAFGYEATPSLLDFIVYINSILILLGFVLLGNKDIFIFDNQ